MQLLLLSKQLLPKSDISNQNDNYRTLYRCYVYVTSTDTPGQRLICKVSEIKNDITKYYFSSFIRFLK